MNVKEAIDVLERESKRIPQDVLEKAIEYIYGLIKEKETNCIEQYEPDEKGWRFGAKKKLFDDGNNTGKQLKGNDKTENRGK